LLLAVLNTNVKTIVSHVFTSADIQQVHVYQVSPALTVIEKTTARAFASLVGFTGPHAGGVSQQGGSASNTTSIIIARNTLYPESKTAGNGSHKFTLFTSEHGHYSLEKAAQMCGLGTDNVISIPVDDKGRMIPSSLESAILASKEKGNTPFYVNATAGTTVLGSYDPFEEISKICKKHNLWMHIDGSWGGPVIFSAEHKYKMKGAELADSLAINPHKMMGVPVTCSFLLGSDMRIFHKANTLPAGYLFHSDSSSSPSEEVWDLADLTLQCGRRGDSLKLALSWIYYGTSGFESQINHAFSIASYFATSISSRPNFILISENPPPCLQVCFYYAKDRKLSEKKEENTKVTAEIVQKLILRGFMVDYAPGEKGGFFRVVVNRETRRGTVDGLIKGIEEIGGEITGA
jgi:glutamate decarboxylase